MKITSVNKSWRDFRGSDLIAPGVVLVFDTGVREIVGDVNVLGGYCDDCGIRPEELIVEVLDFREEIDVLLRSVP